jgi:RND family efflux transporter MFP subunit
MAEPTNPQQSHQSYSPSRRDALKRRIRLVLWILLALAIILAIWGITSRLIARSELRKHTVEDARLSVVTAKPQLSDAGDELVLPGIVQAFTEAAVYARTSGYLKSWYTDIGSHVKQGELLAEIETPEVDRQLSQARADLNTAQANLALSHTTNDRWKVLLATHSVSQQDADEKAGDTAAKDAMTNAAAQNVARLNDLESFKRVRAPFDGVITARNTDIGALINAGQSAGSELFRIADTEKLRIYAQVPEVYAATTTIGLKAELRFTEHPGKPYEAEVVRTSNALDPSARTLQVELQLDNQQGEVFPGAYAEVHFKLPSSTRTLRLPANTVLFRAAGLQVATVDSSNRIKLKNILQGRDFGKTVEILDGVDQNDVVVVNPPDSVTDGLPVRIAPPPPAQTQSTGEPGSHQQPRQQGGDKS